MTQTVLDIHVLPHEQSLDTVKSIIMNALDIGFIEATCDHTATEGPPDAKLEEDSRATLTATITYDSDEYETDTELRTALENMVAEAPVYVEATEVNHAKAPTRALPAPDSE